MDDLDRLYLELVARLRGERPSSLTEPLGVAELYEDIIPYRRVRDAVGFRSNDDYETALSRLVAGERSYLLGDSGMQDELREGLEDLLPDIHRYREYRTAEVWLNPATIPPPGDTRYAPPELREREEWRSTPSEGRGPVDEAETVEAETSEAEASEAEQVHVGEEPGDPEAESSGMEIPVPGAGGMTADPDDSRMEAEGTTEVCPVCDERAPEAASFCPFCGGRLTPGICGGCGRRLERTWRFCPGCGTRRGPTGLVT